VQEFREWLLALTEDWQSAENLCAAHTAKLRTRKDDVSIHDRILKALDKVESKLQSHESTYR
jgi:hypothetical protein